MKYNNYVPIYYANSTAFCNEDNVSHRHGISNDLDRLLRFVLGGERRLTEHGLYVNVSVFFHPDPNVCQSGVQDIFTMELIR